MAALRAVRCTPRVALPTCTPARSFSSSSRLSDLARMQIIGRLAATPEPTQTSTGKTLVRYALATSYGPRDNRSTSWFNVTCFAEDGERGENRMNLMSTLEKGTLLYVEAESQMRTYEGEDGKTHKSLSLIQKNLQILSRPQNRSTEESEAAEVSAAANA